MRSKQPYASFGQKLKNLREKARETLAEVSGALEIHPAELEQIEKGEVRPSEDILMMLISHFNAAEPEAVRLWELAGYKKDFDDRVDAPDITNQPTIMITALDSRIVYTDSVQVMANDFGVVMNFMQNAGPGSQPLAIAKIGMSHQHARSVIEILQKTLAGISSAPQPPKQLPSGDKKQKND